ncbi:MAG: hydrolase [Planctomycetota bacterium]|nr:hydrolase [Planctomycetota bacterium]
MNFEAPDPRLIRMNPDYIRSPELLSRVHSRLLIVDVQQRLIDHIHESTLVVRNCRRLIEGAGILEVPVAATEQYPTGLGTTVPELARLLGDCPEKLRFSCAEVLAWNLANVISDSVESTRNQVVVAGIESHVCVQQTVLDFLSAGFRVFVPADAVSSRNKFDWEIALRRMSDSGATITTTESVLFEWCEVAGTPEFKQISKLVVGE